MLSVGRELNINKALATCRTCRWDGKGTELSDGLVQINSTPAYLYVYICPVCGSAELERKGRLLQFPRSVAKEGEDPAPVKSEGARS